MQGYVMSHQACKHFGSMIKEYKSHKLGSKFFSQWKKNFFYGISRLNTFCLLNKENSYGAPYLTTYSLNRSILYKTLIILWNLERGSPGTHLPAAVHTEWSSWSLAGSMGTCRREGSRASPASRLPYPTAPALGTHVKRISENSHGKDRKGGGWSLCTPGQSGAA